MDANFPFTITGDDFIITTHLKRNKTTGYEFEKSTLSRFFDAKINPNKESDFEAGLSLLFDKFPYNLRIIILNKNDIQIFQTNEHEKMIHERLSYSSHQPESLVKRRINKLRVAKGFNPELILANQFNEEELHAEIINSSLDSLNGDFEGLTVFSGERVWSGWFDMFCLLKFLLNNDNNTSYYALDSYGIWQYLLSHIKVDRRLLEIDKGLLEPDLTFIDNRNHKIFSKAGTIKINKSNKIKNLHLLDQPYSFFDLKETGFEISEMNSYLAKYLLIKNSKNCNLNAKVFEKQRGFLQNSSDKNRKIIYAQKKYFRVEEGSISLVSCFPIKVWPQIGDLVAENDTLFTIASRVSKYVEIPSGSELMVTNKQLVVPGDTLFQMKLANKKRIITTSVAGKVSLSLIDKGLLEINSDEKIVSISSNWDAKVSGIIQPNCIQLKLPIIKIPLSYESGLHFAGVFSEWSKSVAPALAKSFYKTILYIRKPEQIEIDEYLFRSGRIAGVIINNFGSVTKKILLALKKLAIPVLVLEPTSKNGNSNYEKILHYNLDKYLEVDNDHLKIPESNIKSIIKLIGVNDDERSIMKGSKVRFLNYQSEYLYGKIEKSPSDLNDNLLVNLPDGIFEARPENIILI